MGPLPIRFADPHQDALPVEPGRNLLHALTGQIVPEDLPDDLRPLLVNLNFPVPENIAKGDGSGEEGTALHARLVAPAHIFRDVLALPLRHGGKYGGEQLTAHIGRVDMLLLEAHPHTDGLQLPDGAQAVPGVAGEPGDRLDQHLVYPPTAAVRQEALEVRALLRRGACDTLVGIEVSQRPVLLGADQGGVVVELGHEGVELVGGVRTDPAVGRYPELLRLLSWRGLDHNNILLFQREAPAGLRLSAHGLHLLLSATNSTTTRPE